ncbi:hypothetical protein UFO1_2467 [Pelosinus sp. UFO1]|nr:hypothetical protein UFO1_2467 [Pelosinus sp. UFO1]
MIVRCGDRECIYYTSKECTAPELDHTAERFCTMGRRKPKDETRELMRESEPKGYKRGNKWVSN